MLSRSQLHLPRQVAILSRWSLLVRQARLQRFFFRAKKKNWAQELQRSKRGMMLTQFRLQASIVVRFWCWMLHHFFPTKDFIHPYLLAKLSKDQKDGDLRLLKKKIAVLRKQKNQKFWKDQQKVKRRMLMTGKNWFAKMIEIRLAKKKTKNMTPKMLERGLLQKNQVLTSEVQKTELDLGYLIWS